MTACFPIRAAALSVVLGAVFLNAFSTAAYAQTQSVYGYDFVTIGDAGNRGTNEFERRIDIRSFGYGAVDYEYRIATKEVTIGQYFEFVKAYVPHYSARTGNAFGEPAFTGNGIFTIGTVAFLEDGYSLNRAANMSWEYAARYVNWLHNGKATNAAAFENGVYDTSTFTQNPDGTWNHQAAHNPDAKFWMPTRDEWTKAGHWDPAKNNGEGGYWMFPNGSDQDSIPGLLPEDGGQRNAGNRPLFPLDVGSFADVTSPWGMMDMSGGLSEWIETSSPRDPRQRAALGTAYYYDGFNSPFSDDIVGSGTGMTATFPGYGLRLAMAVPAPGAVACLGIGIIFTRRKR